MAAPADLELAADSKKKGKSKILLIVGIVVLAVVLLVGAVLGTLYLTGGLHKPAEGEGDGGEHAAEKEKDKEPPKPAIYIKFEPPFVVNFDGQGKARFLQVSVEVMGREEEKIKKVEANMPAVRNALLLLLSSQTYDAISTTQGKEALRKNAVAQVKAIMKKETGEDDILEDLYFTSFVMQ